MMRLLLLILTMCITVANYAQTWQWAKRGGAVEEVYNIFPVTVGERILPGAAKACLSTIPMKDRMCCWRVSTRTQVNVLPLIEFPAPRDIWIPVPHLQLMRLAITFLAGGSKVISTSMELPLQIQAIRVISS